MITDELRAVNYDLQLSKVEHDSTFVGIYHTYLPTHTGTETGRWTDSYT